MRKNSKALTLVELLVAVGLGVILISVITFVWLQSNRIFTTTLHRLEAYQRLRTVLDIMERDLANTNRTVDMEFYIDKNGNGHYDGGGPPDEEPLIGPVATGSPAEVFPSSGGYDGAFRAPSDPNDPVFLASAAEFQEDTTPANGNNAGFSRWPYFYAPVIFSPPPYRIEVDVYTDVRHYWRDEIYVRTFAMVDGVNRPAMVHYRLFHGVDGRSSLRRRIWYLNGDGAIILPTSGSDRPTDRVSMLVSDIADLKVGFYFKKTPTEGDGYWYHVGDAVDVPNSGNRPGQTLEQLDQNAGWWGALDGAPGTPAGAPPLGDGPGALSSQHYNNGFGQFGDPATADTGANAVSFFYEGFARVELAMGVTRLRTIDEANWVTDPAASPPAPAASQYNNFGFEGVRTGDKIFVYDALDDDTDNAVSGVREPGVSFEDRVFTVDAVTADDATWVAVQFEEPINWFRLRRRWLGNETVTAMTNPNRDLQSSFTCGYRVGFLPAAFRVVLSIDDKFNKKILPMERVIRLLQQ